MHLRAAIGLAFLSGFIALGYEILWARRLADAIGATALAAGLVFGTFFVFLALGAIVMGPRASRSTSPWRLYAQLELGVLAGILPAFFGDALTGAIARLLGDTLFAPGIGLFVKALVAILFVGGASFCMGGTMPALGQAVVRAGALGRDGNMLYGANTLGAAFGILVTTFYLAPTIGMRASFLVLMAGSAAIAAVAWTLRRRTEPEAIHHASSAESRLPTAPLFAPRIWLALAFISGFNVLGLEILSIHLFSQVLHNSTYTFATVLVVVIASLAVGAFAVQRLRLTEAKAASTVAFVLLLAACATALLPRAFVAVTGGLQPFGGGVASIAEYVARILGLGALLLGPVFVLAGWIFPLVLAGIDTAKAHDSRSHVGRTWGRLLGANAAGALTGLVIASFVTLPALGLWISFTVFAVVAFAVAILLAPRTQPRGAARVRLAIGATAALIALLAAFPARLPVAALRPGDKLLEVKAGADGIAAAIAIASNTRGVPPDRRIKLNNTYSLGGTANAAQQFRMGLLPLLLHPAPQRVGYIGIATGITAAAGLRDPAVQRVTAVELSPEVTELACRHFADVNANLCADSRARVVVEDGRLFFRATRDSFDAVIGDLFVPWQAGTANLYTREHFEAVRDHLAPGGLYAQWLPLFQLDPIGYFGIVSTFTTVFPNAWIAVSDFQPYSPALALIGWRDADGAPSMDVLDARCRQVQALERLSEPMLADARGAAAFLVGPAASVLPPGGIPLLTIDRPWLAEHAPRIQRIQPGQWFIGAPLAGYLQRVGAAVSPADPLAPHLALGQTIYAFAERVEREGVDQAVAWYESLQPTPPPLPAGLFTVANPDRLSWPFTMPVGLYLLQRARHEQAAQVTATP